MICDKWLHVYGNKLGTGVNCEWVDDVRENVRGVWIDAQYPFSKCSICDCYFDTANNEANFCPNCGADMRGEEA